MPARTVLARYAGLGLFGIFLIGARALSFMLAGLRAAKRLHRNMFDRLLRAPVSFYDTTPTGTAMPPRPAPPPCFTA